MAAPADVHAETATRKCSPQKEVETSETNGEDIDALILTYLALGLGTEAEALSERNDAPLQAAIARVINDEATAQDANSGHLWPAENMFRL